MRANRLAAIALLLFASFEPVHTGASPYNVPDILPPVPGAIDKAVTPSNIKITICLPGYSRSVRPTYTISSEIKAKLMREFHPHERFGSYELDHLVPLSLGGAPMDMSNLWLQPRTGLMNASDKDALEFVMWRLVCDNRLSLQQAQSEIAVNWVAAYRRYATPGNLELYHFHGGSPD